jgi:hypothetical protein
MYISCLLFHAIRGKTGQVEQELGKLRGWLMRRVLPTREFHTFLCSRPRASKVSAIKCGSASCFFRDVGLSVDDDDPQV